MPDSAIGFGGADWLEFYLALVLLLATLLWNRRLQLWVTRFATLTRPAMITLFLLPIALRLLLMPRHPVPVPNVYDEFSHLLVADTLLHFRLANPPHPMSRFFETFFVLQHPSYSSIYPLGQGLMLAFGRVISGLPWAGVLITTGAFCAFCYWALRGYLAPIWAFLGGCLAVMEFGPLNLWMNCYWGGSLPALAGCLVFGSLPRLEIAWRDYTPARKRDAACLGAGFALHLLTRQFESLLLALCVTVFLLPFARCRQSWPHLRRSMVIALLFLCPAVLLILVQNKRVTGHWFVLPEQLSQYQYGVPTSLTIQKPAVPHVDLTPQQALGYKAQLMMHGPDGDSLERFLLRLNYRVRNYRFFLLPPLYLAACASLLLLNRAIWLRVFLSLAIFGLGTNLFPYLLVHYLGGVTCLFVLISVAGFKVLARLRIRDVAVGSEIARVLILLCGGQFCLWYSVHLLEAKDAPFGLMQYETWDFINHRGSSERRVGIAKQLDDIPGNLLVFVHYEPRHIFQEEWVWNAADIDGSRIIFARDLGTEANQELIGYYPHRKIFYLEPDIAPPRLTSR
jgi:hypothetical protein